MRIPIFAFALALGFALVSPATAQPSEPGATPHQPGVPQVAPDAVPGGGPHAHPEGQAQMPNTPRGPMGMMNCPMMQMMCGMRPGAGGMMPGMPGVQPGATPGMPAADETVATLAYRAAGQKMHRDMAAAFTGDADTDFVKIMIAHHQGAIDMAKLALAFGKDGEVRKLAEGIVRQQEAEIAQMKGWLARNNK